MSEAVNAPAPSTPPGPPLGPAPASHRGLAGWAWGLIVAGTAVVALMIGGGTGFGVGLFASHLGEFRTGIIRPGIDERLPGGFGHDGPNWNGGSGHLGKSPARPASPAGPASPVPTP